MRHTKVLVHAQKMRTGAGYCDLRAAVVESTRGEEGLGEEGNGTTCVRSSAGEEVRCGRIGPGLEDC